MVDSMPTSHAPPSNTEILSPKPAVTCAAVVGLSCVYLLADGAASAKPLSLSSCKVNGCEGTRKATVGWSARTIKLTCGLAGSTKVNGPGQNAFASFCANCENSAAQCLTWLASAICTINGLFIGRCLIA